MLISFKPNEADTKRAEDLLAVAGKKYSRDTQLLFSLASLRVVQGRMDDAAKLFRDVVTVNPRHVVALNNLATLLSEKKDQRKEALKYIDKAIEITGTEAALFDTKGTILLFDGQTDKALEFLRAAVDSPEVDPRYRFHLAMAYSDKQDNALARNELEKALQQDLEKQVLTPNEQKRLSELRKALLSP
jgi:Tfp pilus assembly protein PilF